MPAWTAAQISAYFRRDPGHCGVYRLRRKVVFALKDVADAVFDIQSQTESCLDRKRYEGERGLSEAPPAVASTDIEQVIQSIRNVRANFETILATINLG